MWASVWSLRVKVITDQENGLENKNILPVLVEEWGQLKAFWHIYIIMCIINWVWGKNCTLWYYTFLLKLHWPVFFWTIVQLSTQSYSRRQCCYSRKREHWDTIYAKCEQTVEECELVSGGKKRFTALLHLQFISFHYLLRNAKKKKKKKVNLFCYYNFCSTLHTM